MPYGQSVRIVHVTDCYAPRTGGMETQVRALVQEQARWGHEVSVVTATRGSDVASGPDLDGLVRVDRVAMRLPGDLPIHPRARARVDSLLKQIEPDVVHVHVGEVSPFAWGAVRSVVGAGVARVVTVHSVWSAPMRWAVAPFGRHWARTPTVMTAVSRMAAALVERALGVPVGVLPNGIDTDVWVPVPARAHEGVRFVAVQRLAPRKRTAALIRAFSMASESSPRMHLDIIGDGPERSRLERRVRSWGRDDRIHFHGRRTPAQIRALFEESDVFVQASRRESFGIAALEARTAGLPVVAFRDSGTSDFIHSGIEGILVRDDACLSRAISIIGDDAELRTMIALHNASVPVDQSWPRVLPMVDDAYERAHNALRLAA